MKIARYLLAVALPMAVWSCGGSGGVTAASNAPLAATYRTSFLRSVVPNTSLVMFINQDGFVGAQLNSATEVEYAGTGHFIGNSVSFTMKAVGSLATGTVFVNASLQPGDPPTLSMVLSGAVVANGLVATQIAASEVVLSAGTYTGTLEDGDTGTLTLEVSETGAVTGTVNSTLNGDNLPVSGSVDLDGEIHFSYTTISGSGVFDGYLFIPPNATEFSGEGDWDFGELSGDWHATKSVG